MTSLPTLPCDGWATARDLEHVKDCDPDLGIDPALLTQALTAANRILYLLSGRQFPGSCELTARPCRQGAWGWPSGYEWYSNYGSCGCGASSAAWCACGSYPVFDLGKYPVTSITSVWVDGVQLGANNYRIDDWRYLIRLDGEEWLSCQDLLADPHSADNTFEITFTYGQAPDQGGILAAARLACELAKAYSGVSCSLPERITSISRQGIDMAFIDSQDFLQEGRTGIYQIDLWLKTVNPARSVIPPEIFSPDIPAEHVRKIGT